MEAASAGHVEVAKILLEYGAGINTHSNEFKESALTLACYKGHLEMVSRAGSSPAFVYILETSWAGHSSETSRAAPWPNLVFVVFVYILDIVFLIFPDFFQVRFLLEAGADQEHKTDEMHTALMEASMDGHVEVARLLLDSGAQVNMPADR